MDLHVCSCYNDNPSLALLRSSAQVFCHMFIVYDGYSRILIVFHPLNQTLAYHLLFISQHVGTVDLGVVTRSIWVVLFIKQMKRSQIHKG